MKRAKQFKVTGVKPLTLPRLNEIQGDARKAKRREMLVTCLALNVIGIYKQAHESEIQNGVRWYADARGFCAALARTYHTTPQTVAGVVAALSPNNSWRRNQLDAVTVLNATRESLPPDAVKVGTYNKNKARAFAIASNGAVELGGDKTRAFYSNIAHASSDAVTIDFHAYSAALGVRLTTHTAKGLRSSWYEVISDAYRQAARSLGLTAYEVQAIVWLTWRRLAGVHSMHG